MKTWITLGLMKKRVNKKFKYVYILKRGKPIRKTSFCRNSHPSALKDFLKRKLKNPLTQRIGFLHGIHQVLNMASMYCRKFIVPEIKEYCGTERDRDILNLKIAFISQKLNLFDFDDLVEGIHYFGCKKENLNKEMFSAVQFLNNLDIPRCPCNNSIYSHYYGKMEKCLTKDNVAFSSEYLSSQRLQNKRSFFLTLQKSNNTLFVKNPKQYSWR